MEGQSPCACLELAFVPWDYDETYLGMDRNYADVSLRRCKACGQLWLDYHYENEAFSKSGQWYRGLISDEAAESVGADDALEFLGKLDWYIGGGSYYGCVFKRSGPIEVWP